MTKLKYNYSEFFVKQDKDKLCKFWNVHIPGFNGQITARYEDNHVSFWASSYGDGDIYYENYPFFSAKDCTSFEEADLFLYHNAKKYVAAVLAGYNEIRQSNEED